jgi:endonuclease/exonuclease/phosphatase family metal-dependent hydrolase
MAADTILSYNILDGFQGSRVQKDVFVEWVENVDPNIIFYQELYGFTEDDLRAMARRYGHPSAVRMHEEGYRMGISSKSEITHVERVSTGLRLGYVYARTLDYHLFAVHLDPFKEEDRLKEIALILDHARTLPDDARVMMAGDFNSLARSDAAFYHANREELEKAKKSVNPDWSIDFRVTDTTLESGFSDAYAMLHADFKKSVITPKRILAGDCGRRVDYIFLSPSLKDRCVSAEIIHDGITSYLSDHYPLVVKLQA